MFDHHAIPFRKHSYSQPTPFDQSSRVVTLTAPPTPTQRAFDLEESKGARPMLALRGLELRGVLTFPRY